MGTRQSVLPCVPLLSHYHHSIVPLGLHRRHRSSYMCKHRSPAPNISSAAGKLPPISLASRNSEEVRTQTLGAPRPPTFCTHPPSLEHCRQATALLESGFLKPNLDSAVRYEFHPSTPRTQPPPKRCGAETPRPNIPNRHIPDRVARRGLGRAWPPAWRN